jgi:hypothetical protein
MRRHDSLAENHAALSVLQRVPPYAGGVGAEPKGERLGAAGQP